MRLLFLLSSSLLLGLSSIGQSSAVNFTDLTGVSYDPSSTILLKTAANGWTNGVAFSENELKPGDDGFVEYVVAKSSETKAFGVTSLLDSSNGLKGIEHAFYISKGSLYITNNGKVVKRLGTIKDGIKLNITVQTGQAHFMMNGRRIFRTTVDTTVTNYVGAIIYNSGGSLVGIQTDFEIPIIEEDLPLDEIDFFTVCLNEDAENQTIPLSFDSKVAFSLFNHQVIDGQTLDYEIYGKHRSKLTDQVVINDNKLSKGLSTFELDVSALSEGNYFIEIKCTNNKIIRANFQIPAN